MDGPKIPGHRYNNPTASRQLNGDVRGSYYAGDVYHITSPIPQDPLDQIPVAEHAALDLTEADHDSFCLEDTRTDVLKLINDWTYDPSHREYVFWLSGMAGTGKSTIARTIARDFRAQGVLSASYFFSRGSEDTNNAGLFVETLARQMASDDHQAIIAKDQWQAEFRKALLQSPKAILKIEKWQELILGPASRMRTNLKSFPLVIVIDALDECKKAKEIRDILQVITSRHPDIWLRIIITSRDERPIAALLHRRPATTSAFYLENIPNAIVNSDVGLLFLKTFKNIVYMHGGLPYDWPSAGDIDKLVRRADGLFQYAATICQFLEQEPLLAKEHLALVLTNTVSSSNRRLDDIYLKVLHRFIGKDLGVAFKDQLHRQFRDILGTLVVLQRPPSIEMLALLAGHNKEQILGVLTRLRAVVHFSEDHESPIKLHHKIFSEFLLDETRCVDENFKINAQEAHSLVLSRCLHTMRHHLKQDVCGLKHPGIRKREVEQRRIESALPPQVQYACRYWFYHFWRTNNRSERLVQIEDFLKTSLLYWLEACCWMGKTTEAIEMISTLRRYTEDKHPGGRYADIEEFLLNSRAAIEATPLQVYSSGLIFGPTNNSVRQTHLGHAPTWLTLRYHIDSDLDRCLCTFHGYETFRAPYSLAVSPDNRFLLWMTNFSSCPETKGHIYLLKTGQCLTTISFGHLPDGTHPLYTFSPQGQFLAFVTATSVDGCREHDILLLDTKTMMFHESSQVHRTSVPYLHIKFTSEDDLLLSVSRDAIVKVWDVCTGALQSSFQTDDSACPSLASFSGDGNLLAMISPKSPTSLTIWKVLTGKPMVTLTDLFGVDKLAFSPDGNLLATASSQTKTVDLWDLEHGKKKRAVDVTAYDKSIDKIDFSSDGSIIMCATPKGYLLLLSTETGNILEKSGCHVTSSWCPGDTRFACSGHDRMIRIYRVSCGTGLELTRCASFPGDQDYTHALVFSSDGSSLVSVSDSGTVKVWNTSIDLEWSYIESRKLSIQQVIVSPDGKLAASVTSNSNGLSVQVWDTIVVASPVLIFEALHSCNFAFFHDNRLLILTHRGDPGTTSAFTVDIKQQCSKLDVGAPLGLQWLKMEGRPTKVVLSHDNRYIATVVQEHELQVWNMELRKRVFWNDTSLCSEISFSPNNKIIATRDNQARIKLWSIVKNKRRVMFSGNTIGYSADGRKVAVLTKDSLLQIWDIYRSTRLYQVKLTNIPSPLSFSGTLNGRCLRTDRGSVLLPENCAPILGLPNTPRVDAGHDDRLIFLSHGWIEWREHTVLWLPERYWPTVWATHRNLLVMARGSAKLSFMTIDPVQLGQLLDQSGPSERELALKPNTSPEPSTPQKPKALSSPKARKRKAEHQKKGNRSQQPSKKRSRGESGKVVWIREKSNGHVTLQPERRSTAPSVSVQETTTGSISNPQRERHRVGGVNGLFAHVLRQW